MNTPLSQPYPYIERTCDDHFHSRMCTHNPDDGSTEPLNADEAAAVFLRPLAHLNFRELAQLHQLFERSEIITCRTCTPSVRDLPEKTLLACLSTLCQYDAVDPRALHRYLSGPDAFTKGCHLLEARARQLLTFERNALSTQEKSPRTLCGCATA